MDTQTGEIQSIEDWKERLGDDEVEDRLASGRLVTGTPKELKTRWDQSKLQRLMNGSKNQKKKFRQLTRKNKRKKR